MEETMTKRPRSLELLAPAGDMERLTMEMCIRDRNGSYAWRFRQEEAGSERDK